MMQLLKLAPNKLLSAVTSCSSVGLLKGILYFGTILSAGLMTLSYKLSSDRSELLSGFATTGGGKNLLLILFTGAQLFRLAF